MTAKAEKCGEQPTPETQRPGALLARPSAELYPLAESDEPMYVYRLKGATFLVAGGDLAVYEAGVFSLRPDLRQGLPEAAISGIAGSWPDAAWLVINPGPEHTNAEVYHWVDRHWSLSRSHAGVRYRGVCRWGAHSVAVGSAAAVPDQTLNEAAERPASGGVLQLLDATDDLPPLLDPSKARCDSPVACLTMPAGELLVLAAGCGNLSVELFPPGVIESLTGELALPEVNGVNFANIQIASAGPVVPANSVRHGGVLRAQATGSMTLPLLIQAPLPPTPGFPAVNARIAYGLTAWAPSDPALTFAGLLADRGDISLTSDLAARPFWQTASSIGGRLWVATAEQLWRPTCRKAWQPIDAPPLDGYDKPELYSVRLRDNDEAWAVIRYTRELPQIGQRFVLWGTRPTPKVLAFSTLLRRPCE